MCKICPECDGIMNYDPYFEAEVCAKCGKIERLKINREDPQKNQYQTVDILKNIFGMRTANF